MASLIVMSYAEMLLAMVPAAPPTRKNQRATSCPAPISANVPYLLGSRLICSAFWCVSRTSRFVMKAHYTGRKGETSVKRCLRMMSKVRERQHPRKRQRTGALQNVADRGRTFEERVSVLECVHSCAAFANTFARSRCARLCDEPAKGSICFRDLVDRPAR